MASFVPLHGSWCWLKVKARVRKVPALSRVLLVAHRGRRRVPHAQSLERLRRAV